MQRAIIRMALCFLWAAFAADAARAEPVAVGGQVSPESTLAAPLGKGDAAYLGIDASPTFRLADVQAPFLLLEVVGVYCPQCHVQAPLFDKLFNRLVADQNLSSKVKLFGMAAGATPEEMAYLLESGLYKYPIAADQDFVVHKAMGEPKTPYTLLLDAQGKVLYAHMGIIEDMNAFYEEIARLIR